MAYTVDVVVIGAGLSGLAAVKSCVEENLSVICFDQNDSIGGLWKYKESGQSCMKTTTSNLSKEHFAFSDFPFPPETSNFVRNSVFVKYLESYATNFGLIDKIHLKHAVVNIQAGPQFEQLGNWKVTARNEENGNEIVVISSNVMVCVGIFSKPHMNELKGSKEFKGKIIHSSDYKTPVGYEKKKVVVVGQGNSAFDVAAELGQTAETVYGEIKPGLLVISRLACNGLPFDHVVFSRYNFFRWAAFWSKSDQMAKDCLKLCSAPIDRELYGLSLTGFKSDAHIVAINDLLPYSILTGRVQMKQPINHLTENGVVFNNDSTEYPIDSVIMATGYDIPDLNYIQHLTANDIRYGLYKRVFPYKFEHPTMAFIGLCRFDESTVLLAEIQSRWAVKIFSRKCQLPSKDMMKQEIESIPDHGTASKLPILLPLPYVDDIARLIDVKPNFCKMLITDPKLYFACIFGPLTNYQFRLVGPNSWPKARETILTIPLRVRAGFGLKIEQESRCKQKTGKCIFQMATLGSLCVLLCYLYKNNRLTNIVNNVVMAVKNR
ncbi:flavin-dependent monooxygenase [Chamberlinius hualienensis]